MSIDYFYWAYDFKSFDSMFENAILRFAISDKSI